MTQTILITGATGFVGRQILRALKKSPAKIRLVVRKGKEGDFAQMDDIESVIGSSDLFAEHETWWEGVCRGVDTVIHAAWYAEPGRYLQSPKNLDCLTGTISMAKACAKAGVKRFVGIGTCAEYDMHQGYLPTTTPLKPSTLYAAAKASAFFCLSEYFALAQIEFAWCRLFYLYGEDEDERRLIPYLRNRLAKGQVAELTSGNQVRDYMDVRDAGQRIADVALGKEQGPINVCSGVGVSVKQIAEKIADEFGRRDLLHFGARQDNLFDPEVVVGVVSSEDLNQ